MDRTKRCPCRAGVGGAWHEVSEPKDPRKGCRLGQRAAHSVVSGPELVRELGEGRLVSGRRPESNTLGIIRQIPHRWEQM